MVGLSIKLAIQNAKKRVTWFQAITSFVSGIGCAYLLSGFVTSEFSENATPAIIAIIAMSGEKIGHYLVYKLNIESISEGFIKMLVDRFKK